MVFFQQRQQISRGLGNLAILAELGAVETGFGQSFRLKSA